MSSVQRFVCFWRVQWHSSRVFHSLFWRPSWLFLSSSPPSTTAATGTIFVALMLFGAVGVMFKTYGWSRLALLIGFFLSSKIELLSYQVSAAYGLSFLSRTGSIILIILAFATIFLLLRQKMTPDGRSTVDEVGKQIMFTEIASAVSRYDDPSGQRFGFPREHISHCPKRCAAAATGGHRRSAGMASEMARIALECCLADHVPNFENHGTLIDQVRWCRSPLFLVSYSRLVSSRRRGADQRFIPQHRSKYLVSIIVSVAVLVILWTLSGVLTLQYLSGIIADFLFRFPWWLYAEKPRLLQFE